VSVSSPNGSVWFEQRVAGQVGSLDIAVFPYAGGSPAAFRGWTSASLAARVLVEALPGRGTRFGEPPVDDFDRLVDILARELTPQIGRRFALFGHSLGAYVAFEVARRLPTPPVALFVSGADSPAARVPAPRHRAAMTDGELVDELRRLGGTPAAVLDNEELLELLMPSIRADFGLVDSYGFRPEPLLDCPIHVFGGNRDAHTSPAGLQAWSRHTRGPTDVHLFGGGHFFIHDAEEEVHQHVRETLQPAWAGA
jgi:medium-chain acyl-[acyl-carrier-protein] hydrolase